MSFGWQDVEDIVQDLMTEYPDLNPLEVPLPELHRYVVGLADFSDDAEGSDDELLDAIRLAWNDEYLDQVD